MTRTEVTIAVAAARGVSYISGMIIADWPDGTRTEYARQPSGRYSARHLSVGAACNDDMLFRATRDA